MGSRMLFYIWWLLINGVRDCLAANFLLETAGRKKGGPGKRNRMGAWMAASLLMTYMAIRFSLPGMALLHMLCLIVFARWAFEAEWMDLAVPAAILFTLTTFTEGSAAVALSWLSSSVRMADGGMSLQVLISILSVFVFFLGLLWIRRRYLDALCGIEPSLLYLLLFPSGCMGLLVRFCLRLDGSAFEEYLSFIGEGAGLTVALVMAAAVLLFFLILEMFCKVAVLAKERRTVDLLAGRMWGQKGYLEEARKKNERLASFLHDVDNHLLVLSGLLREQQYTEAAVYADGLCGRAAVLPVSVSSGSLVLDVLLDEKLNDAREEGMRAACDVRISKECAVEGMDLCILFANILDNAIHGCRKYAEATGETPDFSIQAYGRGRLLVIESENAAFLPNPVEEGTGLGNIRRIAKQYQGAVEIEAGDGRFRIRVLLCF